MTVQPTELHHAEKNLTKRQISVPPQSEAWTKNGHRSETCLDAPLVLHQSLFVLSSLSALPCLSATPRPLLLLLHLH